MQRGDILQAASSEDLARLYYTRLLLRRAVRQSRSGGPPRFWARCTLARPLECIMNSRVRYILEADRMTQVDETLRPHLHLRPPG